MFFLELHSAFYFTELYLKIFHSSLNWSTVISPYILIMCCVLCLVSYLKKNVSVVITEPETKALIYFGGGRCPMNISEKYQKLKI